MSSRLPNNAKRCKIDAAQNLIAMHGSGQTNDRLRRHNANSWREGSD